LGHGRLGWVRSGLVGLSVRDFHIVGLTFFLLGYVTLRYVSYGYFSVFLDVNLYYVTLIWVWLV
jgi:hypothetical protein